MAFDINYLVGKTVQITSNVHGSFTANVLSASDNEIILDPTTISGYLNHWLVDGSETRNITYIHETTSPVSLNLDIPLAIINSTYDNVYIDIAYESKAYINTLPESKFRFLTTSDRNSYFLIHKSELVTDLRIKVGSQFMTCVMPFWTQISAGSINVNHRFVDAAARDAYFVSNPLELVDNLVVEIGGAWISAPSGTFTYAFEDTDARDTYFAANPANLINGIIAKIGPVKSGELEYPTVDDFPGTGNPDILYIAQNTGYFYEWSGSGYTQVYYSYLEYSCQYFEYTMESWIDTDPIFELLTESCTMNVVLIYQESYGYARSPINHSESSNTILGTYDGICCTNITAQSGTLGFRTTLTYGGENALNNTFMIETTITILYKNIVGDPLLDGEGCVPSYFNSAKVHLV